MDENGIYVSGKMEGLLIEGSMAKVTIDSSIPMMIDYF